MVTLQERKDEILALPGVIVVDELNNKPWPNKSGWSVLTLRVFRVIGNIIKEIGQGIVVDDSGNTYFLNNDIFARERNPETLITVQESDVMAALDAAGKTYEGVIITPAKFFCEVVVYERDDANNQVVPTSYAVKPKAGGGFHIRKLIAGN